MQRPSSPLLTPNTFRDSNEISTPRERAQPLVAATTAFSAESMDYDPPTQHSIVRSVDSGESAASRHDDPNRSRITNRSLAKSIVRPDDHNDDNGDDRSNREPQMAPERMIFDDNSVLEASGYATSRRADLSADEAYALQLQQEEYSRESLASARHPFFPFRVDSDDEPTPSALSASAEGDERPFTNDEQFAAYLQEREDRTRSLFHRHPGLMFPSRQRSNPDPSELLQPDETEPVPAMFWPFLHGHPSRNNDDSDDDNNPYANIPHPLLQMLAHSNRFPGFRGRAYRRSGSLQETEDDFGPEDYERLLQLDDTIRKKKLTTEQINSLPVETFRRTSNNSDEENKCAVCIELFKVDQTLRRFPCRHIYHKECADRWLQENNVCPICREPPIKGQPVSHSRHQRGATHSRRSSHTHQTPSTRTAHPRRGPPSQRPS